jgi:hypothetical protein
MKTAGVLLFSLDGCVHDTHGSGAAAQCPNVIVEYHRHDTSSTSGTGTPR